MAYRARKQYKMAAFSGSRFSWAGTDYSNMMLSSDITIPDSISINTALSQAMPTSPSSGTFTRSFIFPEVYDVVSVFDGTAYGTVKMGVDMPDISSGNHPRVTSVNIKLEAIDESGVSRTLIPQTEVEDQDFGLDPYDETMTYAFMWWLQVDDIQVELNERMKFTIIADWNNPDALNDRDGSVKLYNSRNGEDTMIVLPAVIE